MQEYVTRAVVLDKEARSGEADAWYAFFTERYGKVMAKAVSVRKIVSKLAGHLEPGSLAAIRVVEQHGTRVVDALAAGRIPVSVSLGELAALSSLLPEWQPERELWSELVPPRREQNVRVSDDDTSPAQARQHFSWPRALAILGWDPAGAACASCGASVSLASSTGLGAMGSAVAAPRDRRAKYFLIRSQEFFCAPCAAVFFRRPSSRVRNQVLLIDES